MTSTATETTATATVAPKPATATKRAPRKTSTPATKKAATKAPAKATTTKAAPVASDRKVKQDVAQHLINIGADWFTSLPSRTQKGTKEVQFNGEWIARETVYESIRQVFAYTPAMCWHPKLGARNIGRGASTRAA